MIIGERLAVFISYLGMNNNSFAAKLGIKTTVIHNITKGRNSPGFDLITKILLTFDNISPDWLLLERGEMLRNDKKNAGLYAGQSAELPVNFVGEHSTNYFKQDLNASKKTDTNKDCEGCKERDRTIKAQEIHIKDLQSQVTTQTEYIRYLKEISPGLPGQNQTSESPHNYGQKRKAG